MICCCIWALLYLETTYFCHRCSHKPAGSGYKSIVRWWCDNGTTHGREKSIKFFITAVLVFLHKSWCVHDSQYHSDLSAGGSSSWSMQMLWSTSIASIALYIVCISMCSPMPFKDKKKTFKKSICMFRCNTNWGKKNIEFLHVRYVCGWCTSKFCLIKGLQDIRR